MASGVQGYSATPKIPAPSPGVQAPRSSGGETEPHSRATRTKRASARLRADQRKKPSNWMAFFFGWGAGIRTPEMSESESDALPLGDTPIFGTRDIIAKANGFVNSFFEKSFCRTKIFAKNLVKRRTLWYNIPVAMRNYAQQPIFLPVAQLDSASDSDSEGRRFKSFRVGQKRGTARCLFFGLPFG